MKKLFSLLLVGIVAISMFGFITPNSVDAAEATPSKGTVYVKNTSHSIGYGANFVVDFYNASGKNIGGYNSGRLNKTEERHYTIPQEAKSVTVRTKKKSTFCWNNVNFFVFKLDESSDSLDGSISVNAIGKSLLKAGFTKSSAGCWKFAYQKY